LGAEREAPRIRGAKRQAQLEPELVAAGVVAFVRDFGIDRPRLPRVGLDARGDARARELARARAAAREPAVLRRGAAPNTALAAPVALHPGLGLGRARSAEEVAPVVPFRALLEVEAPLAEDAARPLLDVADRALGLDPVRLLLEAEVVHLG